MNVLQKNLHFIMVLGISLFVVGCSMFSSAEELPDVPVNFVHNGSFELVDPDGLPEGDHRYSVGEITLDDGVARSGQRSLRIASRKESDDHTLFGVNGTMTNELQPGKTYRFTVWFRAPEMVRESSGRLSFYPRLAAPIIDDVRINWRPEWIHPVESDAVYDLHHGGILLYIYPDADKINDPDAWHKLSATFTVPEQPVPPELNRVIVNFYNLSLDHDVWIDDMSFIEVE